MRSIGVSLLAIAASLAVAASAQAGNDAEFIALGELPGGVFSSRPFAVSADGSVVAGWGWSSFGREAWVWTKGTGMVALGDLPGGSFESKAFGISDDGMVVVGTSISGTTSDGSASFEAFRWTAANGLEGLGSLGEICQPLGYCFDSSSATAASADGGVIAGDTTTPSSAGGKPMTWTPARGMKILSKFPAEGSGDVNAVSADGSVVVGVLFANLDGDPNLEDAGYLWDAVSGIQLFHDFYGEYGGVPSDVSSDGSTVTGYALSPRAGIAGSEAFRWTAAGGLEPLGFLDESEYGIGRPASWPEGISGDGAIVVGNATVNSEDIFNSQQAFIWDEAHGMRNLRDVLVEVYGLDLADWGTLRAEAISADGRAIVGFGNSPPGSSQAWLAILPPEPTAVPAMGSTGLVATTLLCFLAGFFALAHRIRR